MENKYWDCPMGNRCCGLSFATIVCPDRAVILVPLISN